MSEDSTVHCFGYYNRVGDLFYCTTSPTDYLVFNVTVKWSHSVAYDLKADVIYELRFVHDSHTPPRPCCLICEKQWNCDPEDYPGLSQAEIVDWVDDPVVVCGLVRDWVVENAGVS